jgi:hypothetical protein
LCGRADRHCDREQEEKRDPQGSVAGARRVCVALHTHEEEEDGGSCFALLTATTDLPDDLCLTLSYRC